VKRNHQVLKKESSNKGHACLIETWQPQKNRVACSFPFGAKPHNKSGQIHNLKINHGAVVVVSQQ